MAWYKKAIFNWASTGGSSEKEHEESKRVKGLSERFERVFRGSRGYGYFDYDLEKKVLNWDARFWEVIGYTESDMALISDPSHILDYVHPEDKEPLSKAFSDHLSGGQLNEAGFRIRKKRGGHIWVEVRVDSVRDEKNRIQHVSGIILNVSRLKQTEQALQISEARHARILQSTDDGIWEWSAESGGFHFSNRCWEHLGYEDHDDVVNHGVDRIQEWRKRLHPEDGKRFDKILEDHINRRGPFDVEYRIRGKDDKWRWIRARGQMAYNAKGKPSRMSGTNMDITGLKLAEQKVLKAKEDAERAKDEAESANQVKSEFLSNMSHELRTPLNAILGFAQLFESDASLSKKQKANIDEIKKAGKYLLGLVEGVLDLSKIEAGENTLNLENVKPIRVLKECEAILRPQAEDKKITFELLDHSEDLATVRVDAKCLKQILLNLVSNAIKYNKVGGHIKLECAASGLDRLRILVEDTGIGISEKNQINVFQAFNRLGAERSKVEGTGIGLVFSKKLVEQMGGEIGFTSKKNLGSTFWIEFPFDRGEKRFVAELDEPVAQNTSEMMSLRVSDLKRVLYIEDHESNRVLMSQFLSRYPNISLDIADESLRGLFRARTRKPDLIILDINLPGFDGYETLSVLRQDPVTAKIPVIALSARAHVYDIEKAEKAGFDRYLTKPLELNELIVCLNELLAPAV